MALKRQYAEKYSSHIIVNWPSATAGLHPEPNESYRPWLEENIGKQKTDWDWHIYSVVHDTIIIYSNNEAALNMFSLKFN